MPSWQAADRDLFHVQHLSQQPMPLLSVAATPATGRTIQKVEFFQGSTLIGSATTLPYSALWNNVAEGTYRLTAKATDDFGISTSTTPISVKVVQGTKVFYLHTDHLNTPRLATNEQNTVVWRNSLLNDPCEIILDKRQLKVTGIQGCEHEVKEDEVETNRNLPKFDLYGCKDPLVSFCYRLLMEITCHF